MKANAPERIPTPATIGWIERMVGNGSRVVGVEALPVSSTGMHLIELALPDRSRHRVVLRRYDDAGRLAHDPWYVPANEACALELLADSAVPAPRLHAADLEPTFCDVPALLESWVPGAQAWRPANLEGYLADAAEVLGGLGIAAADRFSTLYAEAGGDASTRDPFRDLVDAADLLPLNGVEWGDGGRLERFEDYVQSLLAERSAR